jgi:hypothetical protein
LVGVVKPRRFWISVGGVPAEEPKLTAALFTGLYTFALLSQVYVISIYLPTRVVEAAGRQKLQAVHDSRRDGHRFQRYLNRNRSVVVVGLAPMLVGWLSDFESSLTLILLTTRAGGA